MGAPFLLLLVLASVAEANDFNYRTNNGTITITGYTRPGSDVTIPSTINSLSVTAIGTEAYRYSMSLTSITIPYTVTSIGAGAFESCASMTNLLIGNGLTSIADVAFAQCISLTNVSIGNRVNHIGYESVAYCTHLRTITIPNNVASIAQSAFLNCGSLNAAYFQGNAPSGGDAGIFAYDNNATAHYLPGTTGWGATYGGLPTAPWYLSKPLILSSPAFGLQSNRFGFIVSWATNVPIVVEASPALTTPTWSAISTNTFTAGTAYFADADWTNHPTRFYRLRPL